MDTDKFAITFVTTSLEMEQAEDLRRSVFCGELHWPREAVEDLAENSAGSHAWLALVTLGIKPIATGRLIQREGFWHLEFLAVLERFRSLGVGKLLVEALEIRALEEGAERLRVLAPPENPGRSYFEKLGYKSVNASELEKLIKLNYGEP